MEEQINKTQEIISSELRYQEDVGFAFKAMNIFDISIFQSNSNVDSTFQIELVPKESQAMIRQAQKELKKEGYKILKYSGKGQQGIVVIVEKESKRYAAKIIKIDEYGQINEELALQVEKEVNFLKKANSEYIVNHIDSFRGDFHYFIIMEECLGTLEDILLKSQNQLNENTFIKFGYEILKGVQDAHTQGIILRDIKPENILINYQNKAKLSDFGLAGHLKVEYSILESSNIKGNFLFLSPECAQKYVPEIEAKIKEVFLSRKQQQVTKQVELPKPVQGIKSDIYSIGLVFISLLGGTALQISQKRGNLISEDFVPKAVSKFKNKDIITKIISCMNQYLPQDRISIQDAIKLFEKMEYVISPEKVRQIIDPPLHKQDQQKLEQEGAQVIINQDNYLPYSLLQDSANLQTFQQNILAHKSLKNQYYQPCARIDLSEIEFFLQKCIPGNLNEYSFPVLKMDAGYYAYDSLGYVVFTYPNVKDHNDQLLNHSQYRRIVFFMCNEYAYEDIEVTENNPIQFFNGENLYRKVFYLHDLEKIKNLKHNQTKYLVHMYNMFTGVFQSFYGLLMEDPYFGDF